MTYSPAPSSTSASPGTSTRFIPVMPSLKPNPKCATSSPPTTTGTIASRYHAALVRPSDMDPRMRPSRGSCHGHGRRDAAAHPELADHRDLRRRDRGHQVVADLVGHRLVERALVAVAPQVELQRFELDAELVGRVVDLDRREV